VKHDALPRTVGERKLRNDESGGQRVEGPDGSSDDHCARERGDQTLGHLGEGQVPRRTIVGHNMNQHEEEGTVRARRRGTPAGGR
jgi:hypothetical protein